VRREKDGAKEGAGGVGCSFHGGDLGSGEGKKKEKKNDIVFNERYRGEKSWLVSFRPNARFGERRGKKRKSSPSL